MKRFSYITKSKISNALGIILFFAIVGVSIYVAIKNSETYFQLNVGNSLTLLVALGIAYWATQSKNNHRTQKEHAEKVLIKLQTSVSKECMYIIDNSFNKDKMTMDIRYISNLINLLGKYSDSLGFSEGYKYISTQFSEYKEFIGNKITDIDYLKKSEIELKKYLENINSKCDQIIFDLFS